MSSRLFQNIRERQGLAYAVFSELTPYSDAGMLSIYAGTARQNVERVLRLDCRRIAPHEGRAGQRGGVAPRQGPLQGRRWCFRSNPPERACPIWRARRCISAASSPSRSCKPRSKPSPASRSSRSPANSSSPEKIAAAVVGPLEGFRLTPRPAGLLSALHASLTNFALSSLQTVDAPASLCDDACGPQAPRHHSAGPIRGNRISLRVSILASGSSGNCTLLETSQTRLLVDAGLGKKETLRRLAAVERSVDRLDGIVISHEHSDHIGGLAALLAQWRTTVYLTAATHAETLRILSETHAKRLERVEFIEAGQRFSVGDIEVSPFRDSARRRRSRWASPFAPAA